MNGIKLLDTEVTKMNRKTNEYPYPVTAESETGKLIDEINRRLSENRQQLCWFCSRKSANPARVTVNAGIFPIGTRTAVYGRGCIHHLVSWEWCPRVGLTPRSRQYQELSEAWNNYNTPNSATEQSVIAESRGTLDILTDLPGDAGKIWSIYVEYEPGALKIYQQIARRLGLSWERGARRYYIVGADQLGRACAEFRRHGFVVALCSDAARTVNTDID